jgi:hypothetical protein
MGFCTECGNSIQSDWKYCPNCSKSLQLKKDIDQSISVNDSVISEINQISNTNIVNHIEQKNITECPNCKAKGEVTPRLCQNCKKEYVCDVCKNPLYFGAPTCNSCLSKY